ncbi:MAG: hypothetical protein JST30_10675 [Armatimonadetes bacterium]|nr:hypothetical protein [Armatimonadota bacterium]
MMSVLVAVVILGYVTCATAFYCLSAKSAPWIEETGSSVPGQPVLLVVEGGSGATPDVRSAA